MFSDGQKDRVINLDETDRSLYNTRGKRGWRPSFVFYSEDISGGASRSNKTSYSPTIIAGSRSAGDPLPLHFQLKTHAQSDTGQKLSIDFFSHAKDVVGKFGWTYRIPVPCTWGMNEKLGMDAVELDKYFVNSILPLFPDVENVKKGKVLFRVFICLLDTILSLTYVCFHNAG